MWREIRQEVEIKKQNEAKFRRNQQDCHCCVVRVTDYEPLLLLCVLLFCFVVVTGIICVDILIIAIAMKRS